MEPIKDLEIYNTRMRKSLIDKAFFIDKIPEDFTLVDYGCADGTLIEFLKTVFNGKNHYLGFDCDDQMIQLAKERVKAEFTDSFDEALDWLEENHSPTNILNLSSIIHEIYSYSGYDEIESFWKHQVFGGHFSHIVIRDMIPSSSINRETYANDVRKVLKFANPYSLNSFQNRWGSVKNFKNFAHFLLKYPYVENWDREVRENYLPITLEDLYMMIPNDYDIIYQEHYCLPFLHEQIKKDFDIDFNEPTHLKLILQKKTAPIS